MRINDFIDLKCTPATPVLIIFKMCSDFRGQGQQCSQIGQFEVFRFFGTLSFFQYYGSAYGGTVGVNAPHLLEHRRPMQSKVAVRKKVIEEIIYC